MNRIRKINEIRTDTNRGSALLTTLFILFGILAVTMVAIQMIASGIARRRVEGASARAFYAAESGAEQVIGVFKNVGIAATACRDNAAPFESLYFDFANNQCSATLKSAYLDNNNAFPAYQVKVSVTTTQDIILNARGSFGGTNRELLIKFCLPDCLGKNTGDSDGCNGTCL